MDLLHPDPWYFLCDISPNIVGVDLFLVCRCYTTHFKRPFYCVRQISQIVYTLIFPRFIFCRGYWYAVIGSGSFICREILDSLEQSAQPVLRIALKADSSSQYELIIQTGVLDWLLRWRMSIFKSVWQGAEGNFLTACKEDNSASLSFGKYEIALKNTNEVTVVHLPKFCLIFLVVWRNTSSNCEWAWIIFRGPRIYI